MTRTARTRRWTAAVVGGTATGAVLLGGGIALADGTDSPSTTPEAGTSADAPAAPAAGDRVVGTVTAVSDSALTVTDDTGTEHELTLSDDTRFGGGPTSGPDGGPAAGGPGAGGPGGPSAPADGSAPAAPSDGSAPAAPSDGSTPAAPADGSAPAAPADGSAPAAPAEGGSSDSTGAPAAPAAPAAGSVDDIAVGDRVEVRVADGAAVEVHEVVATVDGTVVSVDGTDLTVVTTPGLRVEVDAAALSSLPSVGDDVHLHGTATDDGRSVVADESTDGPR
ncbi:hypothetical protein SAMN05660199_04192 [Klenkia soli]|uniref:DUF5666 domain-containing protein n=1 Tax=Klenkia soli TaxID=1052260 RepID=A0A1H0TLT7_9ACTN|nr:hypothetical protein [Klenkia soli]SDP54994.1 hypothetical protein SAMN05660199_04192 [Klenkia soli]